MGKHIIQRWALCSQGYQLGSPCRANFRKASIAATVSDVVILTISPRRICRSLRTCDRVDPKPKDAKQLSGLPAILGILAAQKYIGNLACDISRVATDKMTADGAMELKHYRVAVVVLYPRLVRTKKMMVASKWPTLSFRLTRNDTIYPSLLRVRGEHSFRRLRHLAN
jgi:hypothetical protein